MIIHKKTIWLTIALCVIVWITDAAIGYYSFIDKGTLWGQMYADVSPHIFYIRSSHIVIFLIFGLILSVVMAKRKQALDAIRLIEEKQRKKKMQFRQIVDLVPHFIFAKDINGKFIVANKAIANVYGTTIKDLIGKTDADFNHNEKEVEFFLAEDRKVIESREINYIKEETITDSEGNKRLLQTTKIPFTTSGIDLPAVLGVSVDITERKLAEEALRQSEANLRITLHSIGDAVITTNTDGIITSMNPTAEKLTGSTLKQAHGKQLADVFNIVNSKTNQPAVNPVEQVLEKGKIVGLANHTMLIAKDGAKYQIADSAAPILDDDEKVTGVVLVFRDVTDEYAMQQTLRESEERLNLAMMVANDGLWDWDLTTDITYFDQRYYTMAGYEPYDFPSIYEEWAKRVHPDDFDQTADALKAHLKGDIPRYDVEFRFRRKDGEWMWIRARGKIVARDEAGKPLRMVGTHSEITERKLAQEKLRQSEENLRITLHSIGDAVITTNTDGIITNMNTTAEKLTGSTLKQSLGKQLTDVFNIVNSQNNQPAVNPVDQVLEKGITVGLANHTMLISKDGATYQIADSAAPILDDDKKVAGVVLVFRDVTDEYAMQEALRESEERFRTIFETARDPIFIKDKNLRYTQVNPSMEAFFKLPAEELIGHTNEDIFGEEIGLNVREIDSRVLNGEVSEEESIRLIEGIPLTFHVIKVPMHDASGHITGLCGIARDITDRKRAEEKLKMTQFSVDNLTDAVYWMGHDAEFLYVNNAAVEALGYSKEELLSMTVIDISPEFPAMAWPALWADLKEKKSFVIHTILERKDKSTFPVEITANLVQFGDNEINCAIVKDITERIQAEEKLRKSEEIFLDFFENSPVGFHIFGNDRIIQAMNEAELDLIGYTHDEIIGKMNWCDLIVDEQKEIFEEHWNELLKHGKVQDVQYTLVHKQGHLIDVILNASARFDENNLLESTRGNIIDITERKRAEELLKMTQFSVDNLTDAVYWMGADAKFTYVNNAAVKALGYSKEELLEMNTHDIGPEFPAEAWPSHWAELKEKKSLVLHTIHKKKDGSTFPVEITANFVQFGDNEINCAIAKDITERKQAEEMLRESEEHLKTTLNSIGDAVISTDTDGVIIGMNPVAEKLTDWTQKQARGKPLTEVFNIVNAHTKQMAVNPVEQVLIKGKIVGLANHTMLIARDGTEYQIADSAAPIRSDNGTVTGVVLIFRDVTVEYELQEALRISEERLAMAMAVANDGMWDWDMKTNQTFFDQRHYIMAGYEIGEFPNTFLGWARRVHPDDISMGRRMVRSYLAGRIPKLDVEFRVRHKDGRWLWIRARGKVVARDENGTPLRMVGTNADITKRKNAELKLRESEEHFRNFFDNALVGFFRSRLSDGLVIEINPKGAQMTGRTPEEIIGKMKSIEFYEDPNKRAKLIEILKRDGEVHNSEVDVVLNDGSKATFSFSLKAYPEEDYLEGVTIDITDRKRAEEMVERFSRIFEESLNEIYLFDSDTLRFVQVNAAAQRNVGYSMEELQELTPIDLKPEHTTESFTKLIAPVRTGEMEKIVFETVHQRKDQSLYDVEVHMQLLKHDHESLFVAIVLDITERKLAEEALRKNEKEYRNLYKNTPVMLHSIDSQGRLLSVSNKWLEVMGYEEDEVIGLKSTEFLTEESKKYAKEVVLPDFFKRGFCSEVPYQYANKNGEIFDVSLSAISETDDSGKIVRSLAVLIDVTDRKRAEEEIIKTNVHLSKLIDSTPGAIALLDVNSNVTRINNNFTDLFGYTSEEAVGKSINELIIPKEKLEEAGMLCDEYWLEHLMGQETETIRIHKNGTPIDVSIIGSPIRIDNKFAGIYAIYQDISERKKMIDAIRDSENQLQRAITNAPYPLMLHSEDGVVIHISNIWTEITGYTHEDISTIEQWVEKAYGAKQDDAMDYIQNLYNLDKREYSGEWTVQTKDGSERIWDFNSAPLGKDSNGRRLLISMAADVTERKQAEEELRKLSRAVEQSPASIVITDTDANMEYVNPKFEELTGYTFEESVGKNPNILKSGFQSDQFYEELWNTLTAGKVWRGELANKKKSGKVYWEFASISPIFNVHGETTHYIAVKEDITERKQAEEELKESEERFRALFEKSADSILIIEDDKFINCNNATINMLGYASKNEFLNVHPAVLSPEKQPDGRNSFEKADEMMAIAFKEGSHRFEWDHKRHNGEVFPVEVLMTAIPFAEGNFLHVVWRDITERKLAEDALQESEEKYRSITETAMDAIVSVFDNKIYYVNKSAQRIFGYSSDEMVGQPVTLIIPKRFQEAHNIGINKYYDSGQGKYIGKTFEADARHKAGHEFPVELTLTSWKREKKIYLSAIMRDLTKRKKAEAELSKLAKLESLGILAGGIAHNFKNILANISFNTGLAKHKPEEGKKYLDNIDSAVVQASALATRFQTFSTGGDPITETISLENVIKDALNIALSGSEIESELNTSGNLWNIDADSKQLNEVFMNLIINSKQAMPKGGKIILSLSNIELTKSNELKLAEGKYVHAIMKDNGIGISKDIISKIFEPFYSSKTNGTGLGLSSALFIIQKHKGSISIDSEIGKWTKVEIYLPATEDDVSTTNTNLGAYIIGESNRVLFMDDQEALRDNMQELGEILDYEIDVAKDGYSAIDAYKKAIESGKPYEVVILDLTITGSDLQGDDVLKELIKINPKVKAIVFSGHSTKPIVAKYKEYGFAGRLEKPVSIENLSKVIREVCKK